MTLTKHAREQMAARKITVNDLNQVIRANQLFKTRISEQTGHQINTYHHDVRGWPLFLSVDINDREILTAYWRGDNGIRGDGK